MLMDFQTFPRMLAKSLSGLSPVNISQVSTVVQTVNATEKSLLSYTS